MQEDLSPREAELRNKALHCLGIVETMLAKRTIERRIQKQLDGLVPAVGSALQEEGKAALAAQVKTADWSREVKDIILENCPSYFDEMVRKSSRNSEVIAKETLDLLLPKAARIVFARHGYK